MLDATGRKNGRGAYLCPSMECLKKAVKGKDWNVPSRWPFPKRCMKLWKRRWKNLADNKRLLSLVGLATRARKVVSGEFSTEKSVKSGKSHLVIVSEEASGQHEEKSLPTCVLTIKSQSICLEQRTNWGMPWEQEFRASLSVEDAGFAKSVVERMNINGGSLNESK